MFKKLLLLILFLIVILLPVLFFSWWRSVTSPVDPDNLETKIVVIFQGWGVEEIAKQLKEEGLIRNVFAFKIMVSKEGISSELQAGDFRLSPSMNLFEVSQTLTHGTLDVWVTIPEGLRKEEIVEIIKNAFAKQKADFDTDGFLKNSLDLEGYLFPDTYLISKDATAEMAIELLQDNFETKYNSLTLDTSLTKKQIVILASLVEREAKHNKDRPIVAGILIKRLKKGWPLQVDASIQYALANQSCIVAGEECQDWWPKVKAQDLKIESPYNSYENKGLPPTPICNPGLASLEAVVQPKETEYWFYLSDLSGNIHYAKTLKEHEKNIKKYLD